MPPFWGLTRLEALVLNVPHFHAEAKSHLMANPSAAFLKNLSVEITPRQIEKLPLLQEHLPKGTPIFIALIDPADVVGQLTAAVALRKAGLEPIPHVPARFVLDETDLKNRIGALAGEAGVTQMLVLGGGAPPPMGKFDAAIQLLQTGVPFGKRSCRTGSFSICLAVISSDRFFRNSREGLSIRWDLASAWKWGAFTKGPPDGLTLKMEATPPIRPKICDSRDTKPTIYPVTSRFSTATWRWWTKCRNCRKDAGFGENPCLATNPRTCRSPLP